MKVYNRFGIVDTSCFDEGPFCTMKIRRQQERRRAISRRAVTFAAIALVLVAAIGVAALRTFSMARSAEINSTSAAATSSNGVELKASVNSTTLAEGQVLNVSISLFNTLSALNNVTTSNDDWMMHGFPVAMWPPCTDNLPVEFDILAGNYNDAQIQAMNPDYGNATSYTCAESTSVQYVAFQPNSDSVNLTALVGVNDYLHSRMVGSYDLDSNFTVSGYWWYPVTSADEGDLNTVVPGSAPAQYTFQYPEVSPTDSTPFKPGAYTLVVGDEWGQVVLIHFLVKA